VPLNIPVDPDIENYMTSEKVDTVYTVETMLLIQVLRNQREILKAIKEMRERKE